MAKLIKRAFKAAHGYGLIKQDLNANEVRLYAIVSSDEKYADIFWQSIIMHKEFRVCKDKEKAVKLLRTYNTTGDVHVQAVKLFFGQDIDKSHPLRYLIKAVVFGVLYGKSAKSLAVELAVEELKVLRKELEELTANDNDLQEKPAKRGLYAA